MSSQNNQEPSPESSPESPSPIISDGGFTRDLYRKIPCTIGYTYVRFEVDGTVKPCCVSKYGTGSILKNDLSEIWHGRQQQAFREKTAQIHVQRFHEKDPEWGFCQQCSHRPANVNNANALGMDISLSDEAK